MALHTWHTTLQDVENVLWRCSRFVQTLDVPNCVRLGLLLTAASPEAFLNILQTVNHVVRITLVSNSGFNCVSGIVLTPLAVMNLTTGYRLASRFTPPVALSNSAALVKRRSAWIAACSSDMALSGCPPQVLR